MVISQITSGISFILLSCFTNAASIALNASRDTYVLYMQLHIRVTHRNGAIKHIFTRIRSTEGSSADCSLFILSLHALALHLAVKILLQIFLYEDLSTLALHTSVGCISLRSLSAGPHFVTQPILLSENIPNIWHKSSTNTRRSDQIETINIMQPHMRLVSHGRFYQWLRLPFLKKYSIKCGKI